MPARTLVVAALCVVATACASAPRAQSFADLANHLRPGQAVTVTDVSGSTVDGRLEGMTPTTITVLVGGEHREIPGDRVARVQRRKRETARGALFGLGIGFGVGLAAQQSSEPSGSPYVDTGAGAGNIAGGMLLGAAVGAGVGAAIQTRQTVYEPTVAPPSPPPVASAFRPPGGR
jgi:hypothetical protein